MLSAAPYHLTGHVAKAARLTGVNYFDLTEDVATTRMVKELADGADDRVHSRNAASRPASSPSSAHDIASRFDKLDTVRLRVGALPQYPSNALSYNLTWSTDGVINEYIERCEAVVDGKLREVPAMEELEEFSLDGTRYEAFNTSGGLGTLCETLEGKVRNLNYKTIRYPGHCALMRVLLNDLQLRNRREVLKDILENAVPATMQDMVIVFVTVTGERDGRHVQETYARKIYGQKVAGTQRTAIQVTTAAGICAMLDLLVAGQAAATGLRAPGGDRPRHLPRQPLRPGLCGRAPGRGPRAGGQEHPPRRGGVRKVSLGGCKALPSLVGRARWGAGHHRNRSPPPLLPTRGRRACRAKLLGSLQNRMTLFGKSSSQASRSCIKTVA